MARRVIKGIRGDHSPAMEVGGEHEGVPLDPVHGRQGLGLSALLQSPEVILRLVKLLGEVPVEVHIVGVVPSGSIIVTVPGPGRGVAIRVEGGQDVDLSVVDQPRDPRLAAIVEGEVFGEVDQHLPTDHLEIILLVNIIFYQIYIPRFRAYYPRTSSWAPSGSWTRGWR